MFVLSLQLGYCSDYPVEFWSYHSKYHMVNASAGIFDQFKSSVIIMLYFYINAHFSTLADLRNHVEVIT